MLTLNPTRRIWSIARAALAAALLLAGSAARATTLVPTDLGQLSRDARTIARGQVVAIETQWTEDHHAIETIVTLQTERYLKGPLGSTVQFRTPGGRYGRFQSITVGAPTFAVGDRVVVFLGARGPAVLHVMGLTQGLFRVARDGAGWRVSPAPVVATAAGRTVPLVRGALSLRPMPLAGFEQQVRTLAGGQP